MTKFTVYLYFIGIVAYLVSSGIQMWLRNIYRATAKSASQKFEEIASIPTSPGSFGFDTHL